MNPGFNQLAQVFCLVVLAFACSNPARAVTFIPLGATWRYLDDGSNQSNAWRTVEYEDDGWRSGPAPLGYGDGDEATEVSYGTNASAKFITTYFRCGFIVPDAAAVTNLVLRMIRDDGAIVYLNGVQVFRDNMPTGTVTYTTRANSGIDSTNETAMVGTNFSPGLLVVTGPNLLAVEIHQESRTSSDISFDLELTDGRSDSPVVDILQPIHNSEFPAPGDVAITVSATDPNGVVTNLQLFAGNTLLAQWTNPPYTVIWSNVAPGAHALTALARDDQGLLSLSRPVKFVIGLGSTNLFLVPVGALWRYLDNGSAPGTGWQGPAFDDSAWKTGPSKFGYGDGDEATTISFGPEATNKYITTYFRHRFDVPNLDEVSALVLRLVRDDGAIVYLNGSEVHRSNMPNGSVNHLTYANSSLGIPEEGSFIRVSLNPAALVAGINTLAVEIHQASPGSLDMGFNLELLGDNFPRLLRGPWLQSPTTTNIIIKWRTDAAFASRVRYGLSPANLNWMESGGTATDHRIVLTNLTPATTYYYSLGTPAGVYLAGAEYCFTTAPVPGTRKKVRFWALGDCGTANADQFNVRDAAQRVLGTNDLDLVLLLGDNAYTDGTDAEYQGAVFDVYSDLLRRTPLFSTIGNHETAQSTSPSPSIPYYQIFSLPTAGEAGGVASGTEDYYAFDHANIHFVCLDSMTSSRAADGPMANWLRADLESTAQTWVIAFWHHPPYSKGSHDSDWEVELVEMRENILPILEAYGVDLVLSGHSHAYERSHLLHGHYGSSATLRSHMQLDRGGGRPDGAGPYLKSAGAADKRGAVYVVAGSAGRISGGDLNHPAMYLSLNRLGSLLVEVDGDRLDASFIRENGQTNDYFSIIKGPVIIDSPVRSTDTQMTFTWATVAGQTYRVDYKDSLTEPQWKVLPDVLLGTGHPITFTNNTPPNSERFYRIRME